eukprot:gene13968-17074_t
MPEQDDEDPSLICRQLSPARAMLVCAPSLLEGVTLNGPDDLQQLPALGALETDRRLHYLLRDSRGNRRDIVLEARLSIEDFEIRKLAALQGLGMTMLPQMNCQQELEVGTLVRLLPGWELRTAETGAEAMAALAECRPALVLVDMNLPDMTGLGLRDRVAADG